MLKVKQPVSVGGIEFDALIGESSVFESDVPEFPIETGFAVSDSIIIKPVTLDMTLFLTNTPVTWKSRFAGQSNRVSYVIKKLESLYFSKKPVTVKTNDKIYTNMAITSISFVKSLELGYAREISIKFKQLQITTARMVSIPAVYGKSGKTGANAGTANTKIVSINGITGITGITGISLSGYYGRGSDNISPASVIYNCMYKR